MDDKTVTFSVYDDKEQEMKQILTVVYDALKRKRDITRQTRSSAIFYQKTPPTLQPTTTPEA